MKKIFKLEDLDCANCANKIEEQIKKLDYITSVSVSFMSQKITLEAPDDFFEEAVKQSKKIIKKVDPDINFIE